MMWVKKVSARSLVDEVVERLETAIFTGELAPGSRLSEQALAGQLGVSRGPLREAIRRLEGRKLVQRVPNVGVRVAALSVRNIVEIMQVQEVLQGMACSLASRAISEDDIRILEDLVRKQKRHLELAGGRDPYNKSLDMEFHSRIIACSGNERLVRILEDDIQYLLRVQRHTYLTDRKGAATLIREHTKILRALKRRDPVAAESAMREHIARARMSKQAEIRKQAATENAEARRGKDR